MANKKKKPVAKQKATDPSQQFAELEEFYEDKLPKNWDELGHSAKLDWFGHKMLLEQREIIRQEEGTKAARDWGFLSEYQLERRRRREVQSKLGSWDDIPAKPGNFRRVYVDKNALLTSKDPKDDNGQKN